MGGVVAWLWPVLAGLSYALALIGVGGLLQPDALGSLALVATVVLHVFALQLFPPRWRPRLATSPSLVAVTLAAWVMTNCDNDCLVGAVAYYAFLVALGGFLAIVVAAPVAWVVRRRNKRPRI